MVDRLRVLFLVNPTAGRGSALRTWQRVQRHLDGSVQYECAIPSSLAETKRVAAEAARSGVERVVVIGGDGTLAAVAGQLAGSDTALGVIPGGTGNDFARNVGLPRTLEGCIAAALGRRSAQFDLGLAEGAHPFINAAGIGFDGAVATAARRWPKGLGGTLPYLGGAVTTLCTFRPFPVEVSVDGQRYEGLATLVAVANGQYYGGGMQIAPLAGNQDGLLDVIVAGPLGRGQLLKLLAQVYSGAHIHHPQVKVLRGRDVRLKARPGVQAHLDGDLLDWRTLAFGIRPGALRVAVPEQV